MSRLDPIRKSHYTPVHVMEFVSGLLFYVNALLSFGVLLIDREHQSGEYNLVLGMFSILVILMLVVGLALRLYLIPRAEDKRRQDFFGSACSVSLIHQKTDGYYNNDVKDPIKRMAAQVLENSLFSKTLAQHMVRRERIKVAVYLIAWLGLLLLKAPDVNWIFAASQAVFSEQVLSKWLRLEWLRTRFERVFEDVFKLFQAKPSIPTFCAMALDYVTSYESSKSNAGISLSSSVFDKLNPSLSAEWEAIKATLKI